MVYSVTKWRKSDRKWYRIVFIGEYRHTVDAKNRIIMPAKFRDELGSSFIVTRGLDGCLAVYTMEQWEQVLEQLKHMPATKKEARGFSRMLTAMAAECECDASGRIQLTSYLKELAGIETHCVIVGNTNTVEIWSAEKWDAYYDEASESFEDYAEALTEYFR